MSSISTPEPLTVAQRVLASAAACLFAGLAGLAFTGMFASVQAEMRPYFGQLAWIVPVGVDAGVLALILAGLLLEWLAMPMPALRWIAAVFMAASIWLNVAAAGGHATGAVGHAALPVLFIACVEAARHAVRRRAGIAAGTIREGIPLARWLLAPWPTFMLWRRMVLWQVTSYRAALGMEQDRRYAITVLRALFGAGWQRTAPADLVWMLRAGVHIDQAVSRAAALTAGQGLDLRDGHGVGAGPDSGTGRDVAPGPYLEAGPGPDQQADRTAGTGRPRPDGRTGPGERKSGPARRTATPRPAGHDRRDDTDLEAAALALLAAEPDLSGGELGRRLGVTERHGRRLRTRLTQAAADPRLDGRQGAGPSPVREAGPDPAPRPDLARGAGPDIGPDANGDLRPDTNPDPDIRADRGSGPRPGSRPDTSGGPGTYPGPVPDMAGEPRPHPAPDIQPEPDAGPKKRTSIRATRCTRTRTHPSHRTWAPGRTGTSGRAGTSLRAGAPGWAGTRPPRQAWITRSCCRPALRPA